MKHAIASLRDTGLLFQESETSETSDESSAISSVEDFPARISRLPASARAWLESGQGYGSSFYESSR